MLMLRNAFLHLARPEEKQSWLFQCCWIDGFCAWDLQTALYLAGISSICGVWRDLQTCVSVKRTVPWVLASLTSPTSFPSNLGTWLHFLPLYQRGGPFCLLGTDWLRELSWNSAGVSAPERIDPSHLFRPQKKHRYPSGWLKQWESTKNV